jgi:hypothetical protein
VWSYGVGDSNFDWTIELAERGAEWCWGAFPRAVPYFFMVDTYERSPNTEIVNEVPGEVPTYQGWFPLAALDCHTRPGQTAIRTYLKYRTSLWAQNYDEMTEAVFVHEGRLLNRLESYSYSFERLLDGLCGPPNAVSLRTRVDILHPEVAEFYRVVVFPQFQNVRRWVLDKIHKEEMARLRRAYMEAWFNES